MAFNADDFVADLQPPVLQWKGETYTGRILSMEEALPLQARFDSVVGKNVPASEVIEMAVEACDAMGIPGDVVRTMPLSAIIAALQDFLACQIEGAPSASPMNTSA